MSGWETCGSHRRVVPFSVMQIRIALKPVDQVWRHLLVARAVENGFFVCSANASGISDGLGSFLVSPRGEILIELPADEERTASAQIDLSAVINDFS